MGCRVRMVLHFTGETRTQNVSSICDRFPSSLTRCIHCPCRDCINASLSLNNHTRYSLACITFCFDPSQRKFMPSCGQSSHRLPCNYYRLSSFINCLLFNVLLAYAFSFGFQKSIFFRSFFKYLLNNEDRKRLYGHSCLICGMLRNYYVY